MSTVKKFRITNSYNQSEHFDKFFEVNTAIGTKTKIPFVVEELKVTMFDGIYVKLTGRRGDIKGILS